MASKRLMGRHGNQQEDYEMEVETETPEYESGIWDWIPVNAILYGGSVLGILLFVGIVLGIVGFALVEKMSPVSVHSFCTESAFFYFDVDPYTGDLGNYSRVWIERTQDHVHVYMQALLFYAQDPVSPGMWASAFGYPARAAIGIDARCIPGVKGRISNTQIFSGNRLCRTAGSGFRYFNVGQIISSFGTPISTTSPLTTTFLEGGSSYVACMANLPDLDVDVVYHQTQMNSEWFLPTIQWEPYLWMVDFAYETDASSDWSPPSHCKTQFRNGCTEDLMVTI
jgi:hypothetical protein